MNLEYLGNGEWKKLDSTSGYNVVPDCNKRPIALAPVFGYYSPNFHAPAPHVSKPDARPSDRADKVIEVIGSVLGATLFFFIRYRKKHPAVRGGGKWVRRW